MSMELFHFQSALRSDMAIPSDDDKSQFPGSKSTFTEKLEFLQPDLYDGIPVYRWKCEALFAIKLLL